jgi:hypothetical protein
MTAGRPAAAVTLLAGLLVAFAGCAGLVLGQRHDRAGLAPGPVPAVAAPSGQAEPPRSSSVTAVPEPVSLIIPAIGVHTRLIRLGITSQGTLQVPATTSVAGWYTWSPRPGAVGSSVIAGHIDSKAGPGIFFRLRLLKPGERVYVRRADGTLAIFAVTAVQTYPKSAFPTALVYGPAPDPALRLISCTGVFDWAIGSYLSNVVVFAVEVSSAGRE